MAQSADFSPEIPICDGIPSVAVSLATPAAPPLHPLLQGLRKARNTRSLTLAQAARLSGLNLSQISQIETGKVDPRLSSLQALAQVLDLAIVLVPKGLLTQFQSLVGENTAAVERTRDPAAWEPQSLVGH